MALRVHGRLTLEVNGESVHLEADGAAWTATVGRFRTLRALLAAPLPFSAGATGHAARSLPAFLAREGIRLDVHGPRGPLMHLGRSARGTRLRIPFLVDVPHVRLAGPFSLFRMLT